MDGIGTRLDLAGSENATSIRGNIALVVAQADAKLPVKGLRIATRDSDNFTADTFEIIRGMCHSSVVDLIDVVGIATTENYYVFDDSIKT